METNHAEVCRELYRGSFKKAQMAACIAGIITLVILILAAMVDYLPDHMSTVRIMFCAALVYGLVLATMMWIPGKALRKSRTLHDADAVMPTRSQL